MSKTLTLPDPHGDLDELALRIALILRPLTDEARVAVLAELPFCSQCGGDDPYHTCQCWNDN